MLLTYKRPNEQKVFYHLLSKHRAAQLENYVPEIGHSTSDYHHLRPLAQVKKLSTRQFSQQNQKGHGRTVSRFTVVSNVSRGRPSSKHSGSADTEAAETVHSYDPFRASRPQNLVSTGEAAQTNVVVHHGRQIVQETRATSRSPRNSTSNSIVGRCKPHSLAPPPPAFASRSSLASSTRSRTSTHGARLAVVHKRGVSFSHVRKLSGASQKKRGATELKQVPQVVDLSTKGLGLVDNESNLRSATANSPSVLYIRSRKNTESPSQPALSLPKQNRISRLWNDDVRQLSSSLAKTCDEAFNRTSLVSTTYTKVSGLEDSQNAACESAISSFGQNDPRHETSTVIPLQIQRPVSRPQGDRSSLDSRPLPLPPTRSDSVNIELAEAREKIQLRKLTGEDSPGYLDRMVSHIDQLIQPVSSPLRQRGDRRAISAPINSRAHETGRLLPSIHESTREGTYSDLSSDFENFLLHGRVKVAASGRNASAPEPSRVKRSPHHDLDDRTSRRDARAKMGVCATQPYSPSPAKPPAPLNIRKKTSQGPPLMSGANGKIDPKERPPKFDLRQQYTGSSLTTDSPHQSSVSELNLPYDPFADKGSNGTVRKKSNWFKRSSRSGDDKVWSIPDKDHVSMSHAPTKNAARHISEEGQAIPMKKKSFGLGRIFRKRTPKHEGDVPIASKWPLPRMSQDTVDLKKDVGFEIQDDNVSVVESILEEQLQSHIERVTNFESPQTRQIEPQQNWLARLFHVKPAMRYICFSVSKRRARQEIVSLLKEWRKYGARDIVVDKERSIIFGRVGPRNCKCSRNMAFLQYND